jgi:amino acid transporter
VLFFVLAGVAPLTVAAGVIPTAYATTGLTGIPAAFLLVAVVLSVWATGYVAMTRHVTNAGAFCALIARGLGRPAGVAAALVALVAYSFLQVGLYGAFGPNAASEASAHLHLYAPWWVWALAAWAVITVLGLVRVDITGKVLGVLLSAEIIVIAAETIAGLARPEGGHLSFAALSPAALTSAGSGTIGGTGGRGRTRLRRVRAGPGTSSDEARHPGAPSRWPPTSPWARSRWCTRGRPGR